MNLEYIQQFIVIVIKSCLKCGCFIKPLDLAAYNQGIYLLFNETLLQVSKWMKVCIFY